MEKWTVLGSQSVLDSRWLRVDRQQVRTERGDVISDYYVANKASFVMVLALTEADQIVLLREYKHGIGNYVWNLPAGAVRAGESPEEAATREVLEEMGYITDTLKFVGSFAVSSSWLRDRAYLFIGRNARQVRPPRLERGESITLHIKSREEILEMVRTGQIDDPYTVLLVLYADRWQP